MTLSFLIREVFGVADPLVIEVLGSIALGALALGSDVAVEQFLNPASFSTELVEDKAFALDQALEDIGVDVAVVLVDRVADVLNALGADG